MAPITRRIKKKTTDDVEFPISSEMLLNHKHFEKTINFESKIEKLPELISKFYDDVDKRAERKRSSRLNSTLLKQAIRNCLQPLLLIPKVEVKTETEEEAAPQHFTRRKPRTKNLSVTNSSRLRSVKEEPTTDSAPNTTLELFHNKSFTLSSSDEDKTATEESSGVESVMEVNAGAFHDRSFTLSSSDDDLNETAMDDKLESRNSKEESVMEVGTGPQSINSLHNKSYTLSSSDDLDETANLLGDMSMNRELDLGGPLHSSTPQSQNHSIYPKGSVAKPVVKLTESANFSTLNKPAMDDNLEGRNSKVESVMEVCTGPQSVHSLHNKSYTLSSSDDDLDETAQLLGDMSMNRELDLGGPLHFGTPQSQNHSIRGKGSVAKSVRLTVVSNEIPHLSTPVAEISGVKPSMRVVSERRRRLQTPKAESSVKPTRNLPAPKKEPSATESVDNNKWKHATDLRQKFLELKVERVKMENEKKTAVLERKRAQEKMKSESYKSPSRSGALSKEKRTPSQRPSKKTRIHFSERKEEKIVVLFPDPPAKDIPGTSSSYKKTNNSYPMTPAKVYTAKSADDYGLEDLSSGGGTDDESAPRKPIPAWADFELVKKAVEKHVEQPPFDVDEYFGAIEKPNLLDMFGRILKPLRKRGSSATWK
ncbi:unnamed protein product [Caenorhabditis brenneri]